MAKTARAGPSPSQGPSIPSRSTIWRVGIQVIEPSSITFPGRLSSNWTGSEEAEIPACSPIRDAGMAGGGLTHNGSHRNNNLDLRFLLALLLVFIHGHWLINLFLTHLPCLTPSHPSLPGSLQYCPGSPRCISLWNLGKNLPLLTFLVTLPLSNVQPGVFYHIFCFLLFPWHCSRLTVFNNPNITYQRILSTNLRTICYEIF